MTKVIVKEVEGKLVATATVDIGLGEVHDERESEEGTMIMSMGIHGMVGMFENLVYEKAQASDFAGYQETLDTYVRFKMMEMLDVEQSPLKLNKNGELEGMKKGVQIEIVGEQS